MLGVDGAEAPARHAVDRWRAGARDRGTGAAALLATGVLLLVAAVAAVAGWSVLGLVTALAACLVAVVALLGAPTPTASPAPALIGLLLVAGMLALASLNTLAPGLWTPVLALPAVIGTTVALTRRWSGARLAAQLELARRRSGIAAQERERRRWARELHDDTLQQLSAMKLVLAAARRTPDLEAAREAVAGATALVDEQIVGLRHLLTDLRPASLDELGLAPALDALAQRTEALHGVRVRVGVRLPEGSDGAPARPAPEVEEAVYRVVQEALTNAAKHARASSVDVRVVGRDDAVLVRVVDDGVGFDPPTAPRGFGLTGMAERAEALDGSLVVDSAPGRGTTVALTVPTGRTAGRTAGATAHRRRPGGARPRPSTAVLDQVLWRARWAAAFVVLLQAPGIAVDPAPPVAVPVAVAVFVAAIAALNLVLRRVGGAGPPGTGSRRTGLAQLVADGVLTFAAIAYLEFDDGNLSWLGLLVVVAEAAWRLERRAALLTWAGVLAAYLGVVAVAHSAYDGRQLHVEELTMVAGTTLAVTLVVAATARRSPAG